MQELNHLPPHDCYYLRGLLHSPEKLLSLFDLSKTDNPSWFSRLVADALITQNSEALYRYFVAATWQAIKRAQLTEEARDELRRLRKEWITDTHTVISAGLSAKQPFELLQDKFFTYFPNDWKSLMHFTLTGELPL